MNKKIKLSLKSPVQEKHIEVSLDKFAIRKYKNYGVAVLEDRAIPDYRDGMNPVNRRVLWSAYELGIRNTSKFVKSARVIGHCLGIYHPHSDTGCYGALVGMTNVGSAINNIQCGLVQGEGNWGTLSNRSSAAMRYTEMRLSKFSDEVLFNKFYLPVVEMGPNFDSSGKEPVILPALLPIVFLNGRFGIAPGAQTNIPSFNFRSVLKTLKSIYDGEEITPKLLYKGLQVTTLFGGVERLDTATKEEKQERLAMFKGMTGRAMLYGNPVFDEKNKAIIASRFGNAKVNIERLINNIGAFSGVMNVLDDSSKGEKYGTLKVNLKRNLTTKDYAQLIKRVDAELSSRENYILNFTERYLDEEGQAQARMKPQSVTEAMTNWVQWRIDLERKACTYWIGEAAKQIRRLELLMIAVDNRKLIIESLDKDLDQEALEQWLAKKLKIEVKEAAIIYDLKVRQLRKLERKGLEAQMKEVKSRKKELEERKANPKPFMAQQLKGFVSLLS
jgi:topoisomerase IV subunit A